jgi:O-antigen/teichoic acid export membrane protein
MTESLRNQAISGVLWSAIQKFGISIVSFISNIVLARLLTPDDYGCIGLLAVFIAISNALVYGGFLSALIQKKNADETDFSTVFYWNLVVSLLLYFILYICAPAIARYYELDVLCKVLRVQSLIIIINGLSAVQSTLLRKAFSFRKLAQINISSSIVSIVVAIILAYYGFGVWALVIQQLVYSSVNTAILWFTSLWRPQLVFSRKSFLALFSYGSFLLLSDLMNNLCDNIQGLIIGKRFSTATMGYYTQAKRLEEVPTQSISQLVAQVTFPIYSKIQDEREKLYFAVKSTLALMNYINFPLMIGLIVVARPLFIVLFSDTWISSIPYFQILCIAGLVNCLQSVNYQVVSASGRSKALFIWNFVKRGSSLILMLVGVLLGVEGVLWGMVISFYIIYIINASLAFQSTNYSILEQIKDSLPLFVLAVIAGAVAYCCSFLFSNDFFLLFSQIIVYVFVYLILSIVFKVDELYVVKSLAVTYLSKLIRSKNR